MSQGVVRSPMVTSTLSSTSDWSFLNAVCTNVGKSKPLANVGFIV